MAKKKTVKQEPLEIKFDGKNFSVAGRIFETRLKAERFLATQIVAEQSDNKQEVEPLNNKNDDTSE